MLKPASSALKLATIDPNQPARWVELPACPRPQALVWTEARGAELTSHRAAAHVAVWTPTQLAGFLDYVRDDKLFAL
ncbi:hypothetical protein [Plantactinospora endophytica]|uniref:DUF397 domain-containing protein n=1 Tax=Plantactinospora endophytica TaxID=673535 RepID=A0ABQ4EE98_9ACTN|nr:hypothetical protein [Plantactinospora endophytica]GIG93055.1 hypothetical protein Pen02_79910 [Plantactinospora endophytica]